ncbi:MAG: winged helix-turn-helix domain-containing protein [Pseudomonadales bacterium]
MTSGKNSEKSACYRFGEFELDLRTRELRQLGEPVALQNKVFDLLAYLIEHRDEAVSKDQLIEAIWPGTVVTESVLTRAVMKARKALGEDSADAVSIRTVHGFGYRFAGEVRAASDEGDARSPHADRGEAPSGAQEPDSVSTPAPLSVAPGDLPATNPERTAAAPELQGHGGRRRLALAGLAALVLAVAAGIGSYLARDPIAADPPPADAALPRLAVLPFENLSPDPEHDYFASGIQADILNEIARATDIRVIGRSSVARYRGTAIPVRQIAAELAVDHLVDGSIRYADGKVRITAQLIEGATGVQLWSQSYDRDFADIFDIQSDVARRIASALRAQMRPGVATAVASDPLRVQAYEEYLIARSYRERVFAVGWRPIIEHTRQALALDPGFIPALWLLHNAYQNRILGESHDDALAQMRALTERARAEDPGHPLTLSLLAKDAGFAWRWDDALRLWSEAVAADPTDPFLLGSAAFAALGAGDPAGALVYAEQGIDADPSHDWPRYARMIALRALGELPQADHEAELVFALRGDRALPAAITQALDAAGRGDLATTERYAEFAVDAVGEPLVPFRGFLLGLARGAPDRQLLDEALRRIPPPNPNKWMAVQSLLALGDLDGAFAALDDVADSHAMYSVIRVTVDPAFATLRGDPRYEAFLRRVRLG